MMMNFYWMRLNVDFVIAVRGWILWVRNGQPVFCKMILKWIFVRIPLFLPLFCYLISERSLTMFFCLSWSSYLMCIPFSSFIPHHHLKFFLIRLITKYTYRIVEKVKNNLVDFCRISAFEFHEAFVIADKVF